MLLEKQDLQVYKYLKIFLPKLQVIIQSSTSILDNQSAEICITWHQFIEHIWVVCTWHRNHMISLLYLDLWWGRWGGLVPKPTTKLLPVSPRAYPICDLAHCLYWSGCTPTSAANNAINAMLAIEKLILLKSLFNAISSLVFRIVCIILSSYICMRQYLSIKKN